MRFGSSVTAAFLVLLAAVPPLASAGAQGANIITGTVRSGDSLVMEATVRVLVPELTRTPTRTGADGRYRILIPRELIRGQTITVEASHRRFGTGRAEVALTFGTMVVNIELSTTTRPATIPEPGRAAAGGEPPAPRTFSADSLTAAGVKGVVAGATISELAGPVDIVSALAGRIPGFLVTTANNASASVPSMWRGPRSISGTVSPLFVVDWVPVDNTGFLSSIAQRFGLGGLDLGSPLQDLSPQDVASVTLLPPAEAVPLFGSRAANGVVLIRTRNGAETDGLAVFAHIQSTGERALRTPQYQNQFGQGRNGQFGFFDGKGGGLNDGVSESWGPALDGQPLPQASWRTRETADVRLWEAKAPSLGDYLNGGGTRSKGIGLQGGNAWGSFRGSISGSSSNPLEPRMKLKRLVGSIAGTAQPTPKLFAAMSLHTAGTEVDNRPNTGFGDLNPVAALTTLPRQVDVDSLFRHLIDQGGRQINYIYTGVNNPSFVNEGITNKDVNGLVVAGASLRYQLSPWLSAAAQGGIDHYHGDRTVTVQPGWEGGYPTALSRGDFSGGGVQTQAISADQTIASLAFTAASKERTRTLTLGYETRSSSGDVTTTVLDRSSAPGGGGIGGGVAGGVEGNDATVASMFAIGTATLGKSLALTAGARREASNVLPAGDESSLYPSVSATFDLLTGMPSLKSRVKWQAAALRASWWRAGNAITPRVLSRVYAGRGTMLDPQIGVVGDARLRNEQTDGMELGTAITVSRNLWLDLAVYNEKSSNLLVADLDPVPVQALAAPTGTVTNRGIEAQVNTVLLRDHRGLTWDASLSFAMNSNEVDAVNGATREVPLGPTLFGGAAIIARAGSPLGAISGRRYLRNDGGALVLKDGLPLPDMNGDPVVFGSWHPSSMAGLSSTIHYRGAEVALLFDARFGGKIFSATNYWGSVSGTLASTIDRPTGGRVLDGVDSVSGSTNTVPVTTEAYYRALGAITEPWVYSASFAKLRELRFTYVVPLDRVPRLEGQTVRVSIVTRNLWTWAKAPYIDPETAYGIGSYQGVEMGQLPNSRSVGIRLSIVP